MDTLFHFIFSIIAGMALGLHIKHKLEIVVFASALALLIDIDHFFGFYRRATFHNVFVIFLIPFLLFLLAYIYERPRGKIKFQSLALLFLIMLVGHVVADMFVEGTVILFYPLSTMEIGMTEFGTTLFDFIHPAVVNKEGIGLVIYLIILAGAIFVEDFIYFFEKQHEKFAKALDDTLKDLF